MTDVISDPALNETVMTMEPVWRIFAVVLFLATIYSALRRGADAVVR